MVACAWSLGGIAQEPPPPAETPAGGPPPRGTEFGFAVFEKNCTACHGNPAVERAPSPAQLRQFTAERILDALTTGPMRAVGDTLTDVERRQVAVSLSGKALGAAASASASDLPNRCAANADMPVPSARSDWNGWGADLGNTRFQSQEAAGLDATSVVKLKLKWVFGLPNATSSYSQPTIVAGRLFVGSDTGYVYSLDAKTGCVYWSYLSQAGVRNAMTLGPIHGHGAVKYAVYYGDLKANTYALDAQTGKLLWAQKVEQNYTDRVTASPAYFRGRLYVPVSSWEEFAASSPSYQCCTSVGAVVALNADTGKQIWKTYVIPQRPKPIRKNSAGVQQWAPAGGSVWNTPTIDPKRNALYIGTGDATTYPAAVTSDAVLAMNLDTGRVLWSYQVHKNDSFVGGCRGASLPDNCPKVGGPDWDIPASVIMRRVADQDYLVVGTKPGDILALNPDKKGELFWRKNVRGGEIAGDNFKNQVPGVSPPRVSGVMWGFSADPTTAYIGLSGEGGLAAMRIVDGQREWLSALDVPKDMPVSNGSATSVIPGVTFLGGSDGVIKAVATQDGSVLWRFNTHLEFDSVDKVPTRGGSISTAGPVVAEGMVYIGSGYAVLGGSPGNAVLAFGID